MHIRMKVALAVEVGLRTTRYQVFKTVVATNGEDILR